MQPDLKKLISAFLGTALIASIFSFAFIKSGVFKGAGSQNLVAGQASSSQNAFANLSLITPPWRVRDSAVSSSKKVFAPTSNLTESLAGLIAQETMTAYESLAKGSSLSISKEAIDQGIKTIEDKTYDQIEVSDSEIIVKHNYSEKDTVDYIEQIRNILKEQVERKEYKNVFNDTITPKKLAAVQTFFVDQEIKALQLTPPETLKETHKKLIKTIRAYKILFENIANYETDPVRTIIALEQKNVFISRYVKDLTSDLEKIASGETALFEKHNKSSIATSFIQKIFVIPVAQAQLTVPTDCVGFSCIEGYIKDALFYAKEAAQWAQDRAQVLLEWAKKMATEALKNTLVQLFVRQTVSWINGNGNPQFITNWKMYAQDATRLGTNKGLEIVSDDACGMFGPIIMERLNNQYSDVANFYMPSYCQKNSIGKALEDFSVNNFTEDSWGAFGAAISPSGNYFHNYVKYSSQISESAEKEAEAAINDALANNGFKSTKNCRNDDGSNSTSPFWDGSCPDGSDAENTTPGIVFKGVLDRAFSAPLDRIVNANDLSALAFNFAESAVTKVISLGVKGLIGLADGATMGASSDSTNYSLADVCAGFQPGTSGYTNCINNVNSSDQAILDLDDEINRYSLEASTTQALENLKSEASSISRNRNTIDTVNRESLSIIQELNSGSGGAPILDEVIRICRNQRLTSIAPAIAAEAQSIRSSLSTISQNISTIHVDFDLMTTDLSILYQTQDPSQLRNLYNQFVRTYNSLASTTQLLTVSQSRRIAIRNLKTEAERNIANQCNTHFTTSTWPGLVQNPW